jgi:autophagy-related protein 18
MFTEMWEPTRDFAFAKIPGMSKGLPTLCALSPSSLMVITADGYFYQYQLDPLVGGEFPLLKQYALAESEEEAGSGIFEGPLASPL